MKGNDYGKGNHANCKYIVTGPLHHRLHEILRGHSAEGGPDLTA